MKNIKHTYDKIKGIYCILNLSNSKIYIGSSNHIYYRLRGHLYHLRKGNHHTNHMQRSFNINGEDKFYSFIVELCSEDKLIEREEYWMNLLKADYNKIFKDLQRPACSYSQETKDKIAVSVKKAHDNGLLHCGRIAIHVYDLLGKYISSYRSHKECIENTATAKSSINRVLSGKHKQANGFQFSTILLDKMPPVVHEKKKRIPMKRTYTVTAKHLNDGIDLTFNTILECAKYFNVSYGNLYKFVNKDVIFHKVYNISTAT